MFNRIFIHVYVGIKYIILIQTSITCTDRYIINIYMYIYTKKIHVYGFYDINISQIKLI